MTMVLSSYDPLPAARRSMNFASQELRPRMTAEPTRRWWCYVVGRRLKCPCGHPMPMRAEIHDTGAIRCDHWIGAERRECGRWVFLLAIRGGGAIVTEVSLDEKAAMRTLTTPAEMLDYLGIFAE